MSKAQEIKEMWCYILTNLTYEVDLKLFLYIFFCHISCKSWEACSQTEIKEISQYIFDLYFFFEVKNIVIFLSIFFDTSLRVTR